MATAAVWGHKILFKDNIYGETKVEIKHSHHFNINATSPQQMNEFTKWICAGLYD